jgi:hypothetical protein
MVGALDQSRSAVCAFLVNLTPNSPTFYWHVSTVSLEDFSVSLRALPEGGEEV